MASKPRKSNTNSGAGTHPHASGDQGVHNDGTARTDVSGDSSSAIGQAFQAFGHNAPPIHHAPIHGMTTPHARLHCRACTAKTYWTRHLDVPPCAHCGGALDALDEI
jgi:hypothetical protein